MANIQKKKESYSQIFDILLKSKKILVMVGVFGFLINILMLVPPLYMLQLYDRVLTSKSEDTLLMLTLIVVILFISMALFEIIRSKILIKLGNQLDLTLSKRIFDSLFELEKKYPTKSSSRFLTDLTQMRQFMTGNGLFAFFDAPWIIVYIVVLFIFHPMFGVFAIFAALVLFGLAIVNEYSTKKELEVANKLNVESNMSVDGALKNAEVIYAMGMKSNIRKLWENKYFGFLNAQYIASNNTAVWTNVSKTLRLLFQSLILGVGAYLTINYEVTPGMMIAASIIMGRALAPLDLIIGSWRGFSSSRASFNKIESLLKEFPIEAEAMPLPKPQGEVTLESVVVVPPNTNIPSLRGVSMKIDKGDIIAIIGSSAAGKSSLAKAVLGLWPLVNGKARLDKADIAQLNKEDIGKYIGYLPQDVELFEGSVSQNIARFGEIDPSKVINAAKVAGVHEMILHLPYGYDTIIGGGGLMLSGGQRQRIGLARALYDDPVLVVLDEPNSNLDKDGEEALVRALKTLKTKGTTAIIITHKENILSVTDKIAIMEAGLLQEYGDTKIVASRKGIKLNYDKDIDTPHVKVAPKITLSKVGN